jgi:fructokinase
VRQVVCWGEVLWDRFPDARHLGGAVANTAFHLAQLGVPVALVSRVGDDALGREATRRLEESGVDVRAVQIDADRPTGQVTVAVESGEPRYQLLGGCAWEWIACEERGVELLQQAPLVYYGTLSQRRQAGRDGLERALGQTPRSCLRFCDPNFRPGHLDGDLVIRLLRGADIVKVNEHEARALEEELGVGAVEAWLVEEIGVQLLAVTRGAHGALLHKGSERIECPGFPAEEGGDTVGCGDAFAAVLMAGWLAEASLAALGTAANRYAAFVASRPGATPRAPAEFLSTLWRSVA